MTRREALTKLKELPPVWAAIGILFALGAVLASWRDIPERVGAVEEANRRQDTELAESRRSNLDIERKLDRLTCYVEAIALEENPIARGCAR